MTEYPPPPSQDPGPVEPSPEPAPEQSAQPGPQPGPRYAATPYPGPQYPAPQYPGPQYAGPQYPEQQFPEQQFPGQPYPGQQYPPQDPGQPYPGGAQYGGGEPPSGPPPSGPAGGTGGGFGGRFGERLLRRPEPRFTVALAGVGAAFALFGTLLWGGKYYVDGLTSAGPSTDRNLLGAGIAALLVVLGLVAAIAQRNGPLVTGGVVAFGVGVPLVIFFLTFDPQSSTGVNWDALFWVSIVLWAIAYLFVPGMRGHTVFVYLTANAIIEYALLKSADNNVTADVVGGSGPSFPSQGTVAAIGMIFGLGYYLIAFLLDRSGRHGPATGLVYPAFSALAVGVIAWRGDLGLAGTGAVTVVLGLLICAYGGHYGRRLTCFAAAGAVVLGVGLLVYDATKDATKAGVTFLLIGIAVVLIAGLLSRALAEPHDMDPEAVVRSR
jgi:hypothetical protein